jgi:hypothetical protein
MLNDWSDRAPPRPGRVPPRSLERRAACLAVVGALSLIGGLLARLLA